MDQPSVDSKEEKLESAKANSSSDHIEGSAGAEEDLINASGHKQELERNFNLLSLCGYAITTSGAWVGLGSSIVGAPL